MRTRTARQDSSGPHALRYMMTTLLTWQARAAGETWRVAPWKRSIHSKIREEQSCSDSAACVLESAHSSSAAVNPLAMSRQQQATLALDISMPMTRAAALVWRASVALGPALSRCERARGTAAWKRAASVWIRLERSREKAILLRKEKSVCRSTPHPRRCEGWMCGCGSCQSESCML